MSRSGASHRLSVQPSVLDRNDPHILAEQLRRTVESLSFTNTYSPWGFVTVSVGAASLVPEENDTVEKLVEAADAGLYAAKRRGRNTVVVHDPVVLSEAC